MSVITRNCVILVCAGDGCGLPFPNPDGEPIHFDGPADPAIKDCLDGGGWATRDDGRRLCYGCRCLELGEPACAGVDNPVEGATVALPGPCFLIRCDGCGVHLGEDDGGEGAAHFDGAEQAAQGVRRWSSPDGWRLIGAAHYCGTCARPSVRWIAVRDALAERTRQDTKWGEQNHKPLKWAAILAEEAGEVAKAALEGDGAEYRTELVQAAAVCLNAIESHDRAALRAAREWER